MTVYNNENRTEKDNNQHQLKTREFGSASARRRAVKKVYLRAATVGACVVERSHSSLLSVVSCRSRLNCGDSSSRCVVPVGLKAEAADSRGRSLTPAGNATIQQSCT